MAEAFLLWCGFALGASAYFVVHSLRLWWAERGLNSMSKRLYFVSFTQEEVITLRACIYMARLIQSRLPVPDDKNNQRIDNLERAIDGLPSIESGVNDGR